METQLETQIDTDSPANTVAAIAYIDAEHQAVYDDVMAKLEATQEEIDDKNTIAREDAIRRAELYADDIQTVLEFDLQERIDGKSRFFPSS